MPPPIFPCIRAIIHTRIRAHYLGLSEDEKADEIGGIGTPLTLLMWAVFAVFCYFFMPAYAKMSTDSAEVIKEVVMYGRIVCVFSFGLFLESIWTKILQANGDMKTPMIAQIAGAVTNMENGIYTIS